jgi:hypothetical protein
LPFFLSFFPKKNQDNQLSVIIKLFKKISCCADKKMHSHFIPLFFLGCKIWEYSASSLLDELFNTSGLLSSIKHAKKIYHKQELCNSVWQK